MLSKPSRKATQRHAESVAKEEVMEVEIGHGDGEVKEVRKVQVVDLTLDSDEDSDADSDSTTCGFFGKGGTRRRRNTVI